VPFGAVAAASPAAVTARATSVLMWRAQHRGGRQPACSERTALPPRRRMGSGWLTCRPSSPRRRGQNGGAARGKNRHGLGRRAGVGRTRRSACGHHDRDGRRRRGDIEAIRPLMADLAANFTHMGRSARADDKNPQPGDRRRWLCGDGGSAGACGGRRHRRRAPAACLAGGHADSSLLQRLFPQMQARDFSPPRAYARSC